MLTLTTLCHESFPFDDLPCLLLEPDDDSPRACLAALVGATENLSELFAEHPEIDDSEPSFGWAFQLSSRVLVEAEVFPRAAAEAELRPLIETYVKRVIEYFRATGAEPGFYSHEELEAGSKAIESLVVADASTYLPLYVEFLSAIDLEHTVEQHDVVRRINVRMTEQQRSELKEVLAGLSGGESFPDF